MKEKIEERTDLGPILVALFLLNLCHSNLFHWFCCYSSECICEIGNIWLINELMVMYSLWLTRQLTFIKYDDGLSRNCMLRVLYIFIVMGVGRRAWMT